MSKSFDIYRKPKSSPPPPAPTYTPKRKNRSSGVGFFFFFIIAIAGIGYAFKTSIPQNLSLKTKQPQNVVQSTQSTKNDNASQTNNPSNKTTTEQSTTTDKTAKVDSKQVKIQILNGTGIDSLTDKVKKTIEDKGYTVESATKAQFEYGQTYVYYRSNSVEAAKAISEVISDYHPTLSESQISGLFDVLVIIGKQNLPDQNTQTTPTAQNSQASTE